jgi:DNA-binding protein H-NS
MTKIDLDSLSIEQLATLRDDATDKLAEKVAARQAELEAELELLSRYGKIAKKSPTAPIAKPSKDSTPKETATKAGTPKEVANSENTTKDGAARDPIVKAA